jgi:hypothetical protein
VRGVGDEQFLEQFAQPRLAELVEAVRPPVLAGLSVRELGQRDLARARLTRMNGVYVHQPAFWTGSAGLNLARSSRRDASRPLA